MKSFKYIIIGLILMFSCDLEKKKVNYNYEGVFGEYEQLKKWVFENIFDEDQIINNETFLEIGLEEDLIKIYEIEDLKMVLIYYHPYWSKESKIECNFLKSKKVLKTIDINGDRHGLGKIYFKDFNEDDELELIHEINHKIPMANVIQLHQKIYQLDFEEPFIREKYNWITKEIDCKNEKEGKVIKYINRYVDGELIRSKDEEIYNCDKFPN